MKIDNTRRRGVQHPKKKIAAALTTAYLLATPTAHADEQQFLNYIHTQGVPSSYASSLPVPLPYPPDYSNIKVANMVCELLHNGNTTADVPFLGTNQNAYRGTLINGAQRFVCPDTLH